MPLGTITAGTGSNGLRVTTASTWANARNHTDGTLAITNFICEASSGFECGRGYFFFDLSTLSSQITINSGSLVLPAVANYVNTVGGTAYITNHTGTNPIAANDTQYNSIGAQTTWGSLAVSSFSTSVANSIALTTTALNNLTPGAINNIGLRHSHDINNVSPGTATDQFTVGATSGTLLLNYVVNISGYRTLLGVGQA